MTQKSLTFGHKNKDRAIRNTLSDLSRNWDKENVCLCSRNQASPFSRNETNECSDTMVIVVTAGYTNFDLDFLLRRIPSAVPSALLPTNQ
jgi:hypothetical protein